jgi:DNA-binding response OmpR family regulator
MTSLEGYVCSKVLQLDRMQRRVYVDGRLLPRSLSSRQFLLLEFLADHAGKVCLREETSRAVYSESYMPHRDDARLDALIERTRLHLGDDQRNPRFIETIRGVGHRLNNYAELTP